MKGKTGIILSLRIMAISAITVILGNFVLPLLFVGAELKSTGEILTYRTSFEFIQSILAVKVLNGFFIVSFIYSAIQLVIKLLNRNRGKES